MTAETPAPTPAVEYEVEHTARASERFTDVMPAAYDDKDDMDLLRQKLNNRKKPIYAGLAFLCVVVIGVSIAVSSGGGSTGATTSSGITEQEQAPAPAPSETDDAAAGVHAAEVNTTSGLSSATASGSGSAANEEAVLFANASSSSSSSSSAAAGVTETPTPSPTDGPILPYHDLGFNWKDGKNWEYSNGGGVPGDMVSNDGIRLTSANSPQPIRTKQGWGGEKIVYIEWERSDSSDTNIWMLNTKIVSQFGANNGWPYYGELDIFEMFTQDKMIQNYDFSGFNQFRDVGSYGALTLHNGPRQGQGDPCFCPASASKSAWFQGSAPMTSGCTAQFANTPKNSMATVWGRDGNGQYLQLWQNPTVTKGGKINGQETYDITPGGTTTMKIYNNAQLFWGTPASAPCAANGGHNPNTGFPFFEDFYLILEEQKKNDGSAWFKVNNIQIFKKN